MEKGVVMAGETLAVTTRRALISNLCRDTDL